MKRLFILILLILAGACSSREPMPARPQRTPLPGSLPATEVDATKPLSERIAMTAINEWVYWGKQRVQTDLDGMSCVTHSPLTVLQPRIEKRFLDDGNDGNDRLDESKDENDVFSSGQRHDCLQFADGDGMEATRLGCERVQRYWAIVGEQPDCFQVTTTGWAWSAVFISWVMRQAGLDASQFLTSEAHAEYIIDYREELLPQPAFRVEPLPAVPRAGDLICATRSDANYIETIDELKPRGTPMHCDIVVDVDPAEKIAWAVGGNVQQSVSLNEITLGPSGQLENDPASGRHWLLILRNQM